MKTLRATNIVRNLDNLLTAKSDTGWNWLVNTIHKGGVKYLLKPS